MHTFREYKLKYTQLVSLPISVLSKGHKGIQYEGRFLWGMATADIANVKEYFLDTSLW